METLRHRTHTMAAFEAVLREARTDLNLREEDYFSPVCVAYALLKEGERPEEVSKLVSWREFEQLSAAVLRASGFAVKENVILTKPRVQIDLVAAGGSTLLSVDCKHYGRQNSPSSLAGFAKNQLRRSGLLRRKTQDPRPIVSVILSLSEPEGKFVEGVAVVPIRTLQSFLNSIDSYHSALELK